VVFDAGRPGFLKEPSARRRGQTMSNSEALSVVNGRLSAISGPSLRIVGGQPAAVDGHKW
jgi:hypothetical protein